MEVIIVARSVCRVEWCLGGTRGGTSGVAQIGLYKKSLTRILGLGFESLVLALRLLLDVDTKAEAHVQGSLSAVLGLV